MIKEIIIGLPQGLIDAPWGTLEVPNAMGTPGVVGELDGIRKCY